MTLSDEINEMIKFALLNIKITSAAGLSPRINRVIDIENLQERDLEQFLSTSGEGSKVAGVPPGHPSLKPRTGDVGLGFSLLRGEGVSSLLGRAGATGIPQISIAIALTQLIPLIIKELQRPGGFLDKRVRIVAQEELFAGLDRDTRQNIRIGDQQIIIQQLQGFRASDGFLSSNTLDLVRTNADRVTDIGLFERAQGMPLGGR